MNLNQMQSAVAVAKFGRFSAAADSLYISQSSLSQQIIALEKELGVKLFQRTTRDVQVTEAGAAFVEASSRILREMDELGQTMSAYAGMLKGTITIGTINALEKIRFGQIITDFYLAYPNLNVDLSCQGSLSLLEALEKQTIDLAFLVRPEEPHPGIDYYPLGRDEYCLLVSRDHPLAERGCISLKEVASERFIINQPSQTISGIFMRACEKAGFVPNIICRNSAAPIAMNLVKAGLGIAFMCGEEAETYRQEGVARLRLSDGIYKEIVMAVSGRREPSRLVQVFMDFVRSWKP